MALCVPPELAKKIKERIGKNSFQIEEIAKMKTDERTKFFNSLIKDESLSKKANLEFEKALLAKKQGAMINWFNSLTKGVEPKKKIDITEKIKDLNEAGFFTGTANDDLYQDIVSQSLGARVTQEEAKKIIKVGDELDKIRIKYDGKNGENKVIGNPLKLKENIEYLNKRRELDNLFDEIDPSTKTEVAIGLVPQLSMLTNVSSPTLNVVNNSFLGAGELISRKVGQIFSDIGIKGKFKRTPEFNKILRDYKKNVMEIYNKTGYDLSRTIDFTEEFGTLGEKKVKTKNKLLKGWSDLVFKYSLGYPDVKAATIHGANSMGQMVETYAKINNLGEKEAINILKESLKPNTKDQVAKMIKSQSLGDAMYGTFTNKTGLSKTTVELKNILNKSVPGLGDFLIPFAKVPSNAIMNGFDYGGIGLVRGTSQILKAFKGGLDTFEDRILLKNGITNLMRSGIGLTGTVLVLANQDIEFVGAYDPRRREIRELQNSNYNAIGIKTKNGTKWISLDYFGPLSTPLAGAFYAKETIKGEKGIGSVITSAIGGEMNYLSDSPIIQAMTTISDTFSQEGNAGEKFVESGKNMALDFVGRYVPGVVGQLATVSDEYARNTKEYGGLGRVINKIPGLRQLMLDKKFNALGKEIRISNEERATKIFFGSRYKPGTTDPTAKEFVRLAESDNKPTFIKFDKPTRNSVKSAKTFLSKDDYIDFNKDYGEILGDKLNKLFETEEYKNADDFIKKEMINDETNDSLNEALLNKGMDDKGTVLSEESKNDLIKERELQEQAEKAYEEGKLEQLVKRTTNKEEKEVLVKKQSSLRAETTRKFKKLLEEEPDKVKEFYNNLTRDEQKRLKDYLNNKDNKDLKIKFSKLK